MFARLNQINAEPDLYILGVFLFGIFVSHHVGSDTANLVSPEH